MLCRFIWFSLCKWLHLDCKSSIHRWTKHFQPFNTANEFHLKWFLLIFPQDEVAFVQNLVYYVERAYRTPDFGMWERGSKSNDGTAEIHASSIGMAKSALEAINGCNLFGEKGASWSVVYVDIDAHNRNRSIFETMLPRESSSKVTEFLKSSVDKLENYLPLLITTNSGCWCIFDSYSVISRVRIPRRTFGRSNQTECGKSPARQTRLQTFQSRWIFVSHRR